MNILKSNLLNIVVMLLLMKKCYSNYSFGNSTEYSTLRLVQLLWRHGDRAPAFIYPTDPHQDIEKLWPNGVGELTKLGEDQQIKLGQYIRQRYDTFVPLVYNKKDILVLSSNIDRAIQSAQANMIGLYGLYDSYGKVDLQLVPIHVLMPEYDNLLAMSAPCPRETAAMTEYINSSPEVQKFLTENQQFIVDALKSAGLENFQLPPGISFLLGVYSIGDAIFCEQIHNLPPPPWANATVVAKLREFGALDFKILGATPELRRLNGGPLAGRILDNMVSLSDDSPKMYMFSGHDTTVASLLTNLGVFNDQLVPYCALVIIDLYQEEQSRKFFVEIFYRNSTDHQPYPLRIPGCGNPCYLDEFKKLVSIYIPEDWKEECKLKTA